MRRIEARQSLLLKKLEEIEAVWMEKRERGRAPHGKRRLLHTPLGAVRTGAFLTFSVKPPAFAGGYCFLAWWDQYRIRSHGGTFKA